MSKIKWVKAAMDSLLASNVHKFAPDPHGDPGHTRTHLNGDARLYQVSGDNILYIVGRIKSDFPREEASSAPALFIF